MYYIFIPTHVRHGVAIKEWINIYKAVIEFIQIISKLWYDKIGSRDN